MSNTVTILVWAIAIEFALVFAFVIFTYISRYFWDQVNSRNTKRSDILRKELNEAQKESHAKKLSYPNRIDLIVPLLQEIDEKIGKTDTRWETVRTEIIKEQLLPKARHLMRKRNWLYHYYLCILLNYYFEPQDEALIVKLIQDKSIVVLINAIPVAIKFGSAKVLRTLVERISTERTHVQRMLISDAFRTPKLLEICAKILHTSHEAYLRKTCFILVNQVGPTRDFFELAQRDIYANELELRLSAIRVLAKSDPEKAVPILKSFLNDPIWQVREVSLTHLAPYADQGSFDTIAGMLHDPVWWVRYRAGLALLHYKKAGEDMLAKISESPTDKYAALEAKYILLRNRPQEES